MRFAALLASMETLKLSHKLGRKENKNADRVSPQRVRADEVRNTLDGINVDIDTTNNRTKGELQHTTIEDTRKGGFFAAWKPHRDNPGRVQSMRKGSRTETTSLRKEEGAIYAQKVGSSPSS
jgi:hypothetical protein